MRRTIEVLAGIQGTSGFQISAEEDSHPYQPRIDFVVTHSSDGQPSKATIQLYNPPSDLIADMLRSSENSFLHLAVGHNNDNFGIFVGVATRGGVAVAQQRDGDVVLKIDALSGGTRYRDAVSTISRNGRVGARYLLGVLAADVGWTVGKVDFEDTAVYTRGYAFSGDSVAAIRQIARFTGTLMIVDDDTVHMVRPENGTGEIIAPLFSTANGTLIESPAVMNNGVQFTTLITHPLRVGMHVLLEYFDYAERAVIQGRFVLREVTYRGSNYGTQFYTSCIARPVGVL